MANGEAFRALSHRGSQVQILPSAFSRTNGVPVPLAFSPHAASFG